MVTTKPEAALIDLVREQEADALDDGFPYEHMGADITLDRTQTGWVTPTAFMIVSFKELLRELMRVYGRTGHFILREIGTENLRDMEFVNGLGLASFLRLQDAALNALPVEEQKRLGFIG